MIMSNDTPNFRGHFPIDGRLRKRNRKVQNGDTQEVSIDTCLLRKDHSQRLVMATRIQKRKHPCGLKECIVRTATDINKLNPKEVAIRFNGTLGLKKKTELKKVAKEKGFKILN